ncbi:hypothetical protein PMAYCL1PPCAC_05706, partial [Pristionchus mayeri]
AGATQQGRRSGWILSHPDDQYYNRQPAIFYRFLPCPMSRSNWSVLQVLQRNRSGSIQAGNDQGHYSRL